MSQQKKGAEKDLDKKLNILRDLIEKENEMLRKMIESLEALEKRMMQPPKKDKGSRRKKKE
jgi:hypothetical protein